MEGEMDKLRIERKTLTDELGRCERGAFPGSAASRREWAAIDALTAFDAAHPEVVAEIQRQRSAEVSGYVD